MPADADTRPCPIPLMPITPADAGTNAGPRRLPALLVRRWRAVVALMLCAYFVAGTFLSLIHI